MGGFCGAEGGWDDGEPKDDARRIRMGEIKRWMAGIWLLCPWRIRQKTYSLFYLLCTERYTRGQKETFQKDCKCLNIHVFVNTL